MVSIEKLRAEQKRLFTRWYMLNDKDALGKWRKITKLISEESYREYEEVRNVITKTNREAAEVL